MQYTTFSQCSDQFYFQSKVILEDLFYGRIFCSELLYSVVCVMAKVYRGLEYTLASNFEAKVNSSPQLSTMRLMCTLASNFHARV